LEVHQDLELPWKPILQKSRMMYELSRKERAAIPQAEEKLLRRSRKARSRL